MTIEVRHPEPHNILAMKKIWKSCFGDSDEYISLFFDNCFKPDMALVAFCDMRPVGMLFMIPTMLNFEGKEYIGEYIYAVAVKKEFRKIGIMRRLEKKATQIATDQKLSFLALIPQSRPLFRMYEKLQYKTAFYTGITSFMPFKYFDVENVKVSACKKDDFLALRSEFLSTKPSFVDLLSPFDEYRYAEIIKIGGSIMTVTINDKLYYFTGFKRNNCYMIKETSLDPIALKKALPVIASTFKVELVKARGLSGRVDEIAPYGMFKSLDGEINVNMLKCKRTYMNMMLD